MSTVRTVVAAVSIGLAVAQTAPAARAQSTALPIVALGDAAPDFSATRLDGGATVTKASYAGKILVLNFWATWCPPCRAETADMVRAFGKLHGSDVAFLGVDTTEVPSVVKTFVSSKGVPYPIALAGPDVYNGFGIVGIPTTIVIDRAGIVRARWIGGVGPEQLTAFVNDARAGKNATVDTPDERIVERLLDPANYDFASPGSIERARNAVAAANAFANAHTTAVATIDYGRVNMLEGNVLLGAAQAQSAAATTPASQTAAALAVSAAYAKLGRFADAVATLQAAQRADPTNAGLSLALANANYRLHDYAAGIVAAQAYTQASPSDPDGWSELGLLEQRSTAFAQAAPAYERSISLMEAMLPRASASDRTDVVANIADTSLDLANVYVALGDVAGATRAFATANRFGDRLDPHGPYADLYRNVHERTQEGMVAVRMAHGNTRTAISVAPWTGPDLPGSVSSTLKFRLIVAKAPNAKVDLRALGLRRGWVASFCADGLCSPNRVSLVLPASGVKTYEFQLVPPSSARDPGIVRIGSSDGAVARV